MISINDVMEDSQNVVCLLLNQKCHPSQYINYGIVKVLLRHSYLSCLKFGIVEAKDVLLTQWLPMELRVEFTIDNSVQQLVSSEMLGIIILDKKVKATHQMLINIGSQGIRLVRTR